MYIAVDFDGTIVTHDYPKIGKPLPYALDTLKKLNERGHKLILLTMRDGNELQEAIEYCKQGGVEFWKHNINPTQRHWTSSPKVYANLYIDDAALGCPTIVDATISDRPFVNWSDVIELLVNKQVL